MNRLETLAKISHYEWMIESLKISPVHKAWLEDKIEELTASLAQFQKIGETALGRSWIGWLPTN
jgi:hypothetical protein